MRAFLFRILYFLRILKLFPQFYFHYEVKKYVKKGDVVIDIGANQGIYTRIFSDLDAFVYAVEPMKMFENVLYRFRHAKVICKALGNKEGIVHLKQWRKTSGAYHIDDNGDYVAIMARGSLIFKHLDKINFIKIDVEGSELPIIEDMAELILKHKSTILIETGQINRVLEFLPGYKIKDRMSNDYLIGV